ncbi:MAG: pullulanase-associated domain-containing protein [Bacillota bacterium]
MNEIWLKEGSETVYNFEPADLPANTVRIHYVREDQKYDNFGLWLWERSLRHSWTLTLLFSPHKMI